MIFYAYFSLAFCLLGKNAVVCYRLETYVYGFSVLSYIKLKYTIFVRNVFAKLQY